MSGSVRPAEWPWAGSLRARGWAAEGGQGGEEEDLVSGQRRADMTKKHSCEAKHYHLSLLTVCIFSALPIISLGG
jgi:hypothetical protein